MSIGWLHHLKGWNKIVVLVDTREQKMLPIKEGGAVEKIERVALPFGDYAVRYLDGSIPPCYFERKSLSDLWGTMTSGYKRFKVEILKAKEAGIDLVLLIEGSLSDVLGGFQHSKFSGESMVQKLFTLMVRHSMKVVFCSSRLEAAYYVVETFETIGRERFE